MVHENARTEREVSCALFQSTRPIALAPEMLCSDERAERLARLAQLRTRRKPTIVDTPLRKESDVSVDPGVRTWKTRLQLQ
jgi:hypothetical protein